MVQWCWEPGLTSPTSESPEPGQALEPTVSSPATSTSGTQLEQREDERTQGAQHGEEGGEKGRDDSI